MGRIQVWTELILLSCMKANPVNALFQTQFEEDSEIQLSDFLKPEKYAELLEYLDKNEKSFHDCVPFNRKFTSEFEPCEGDNPVNQLVEVRNNRVRNSL